MKKLLSPLLAASLLIASIASAQESLSEKLKLSERVSAFMNPPSKQERKEELTRLEKAFASVKAKYRRVMNCLAGKQACNKSDFFILGTTLLVLNGIVTGALQQKRAIESRLIHAWGEGSPSYSLLDESQPAWQYWLRSLNPAEFGRVAGERLYDIYEEKTSTDDKDEDF